MTHHSPFTKDQNEYLVRRTSDLLAYVDRAADAERLDALIRKSFDARIRRIGAPLSPRERRVARRAVRVQRRLLASVRTAPRPVGEPGALRTTVIPEDLLRMSPLGPRIYWQLAQDAVVVCPGVG